MELLLHSMDRRLDVVDAPLLFGGPGDDVGVVVVVVDDVVEMSKQPVASRGLSTGARSG